jgi:hypothetical protein
MSKKPELLSQFELPTSLTPQPEQQYIPPAGHNEAVIKARKARPPGALVLAQQHVGTMTVARSIERSSELTEQDRLFLSQVVAAAGFGSAQFSFRPGRPVMRHHLKLPMLVNPDTDEILSVEARTNEMNRRLGLTVEASRQVYEEKMRTSRVSVKTSYALGRIAGESSLWVAILPHPEIGSSGSPVRTQQEVREACMDALATTRRISGEVGTDLTYAMVGGPATNLTAYIEREAPHGAHNVLTEARQEAATSVYGSL